MKAAVTKEGNRAYYTAIAASLFINLKYIVLLCIFLVLEKTLEYNIVLKIQVQLENYLYIALEADPEDADYFG